MYVMPRLHGAVYIGFYAEGQGAFFGRNRTPCASIGVMSRGLAPQSFPTCLCVFTSGYGRAGDYAAAADFPSSTSTIISSTPTSSALQIL